MSASLVGSEMCIRDSTSAVQELQSRLKSVRGMSVCCDGCGHQRSARTAVSYTHLTLPTICSV
eukprot:3812271-Alexandrium_andersonii.AAC.1